MGDQKSIMALPKRIIKETQRLLAEPAPGISASPSEENARYFNVMIIGPSTSPYEGGVYKLELYLPDDYPMAAPKVRTLTIPWTRTLRGSGGKTKTQPSV